MPGYKRYRRRKRVVRRKPGWASYARSGISLAAKAFALAKYLKSIVNVERKFFDVAQTNQAIGTTAVIYPLTQIAQGDAYNNREGNSVKAKSLFYRQTTVLNTSAEQTFVRVVIFKDMEQNGTSPTAAQLLESSGNYISPLNHVNGTRFKILRDHIVNVTKTLNAKQYETYIRLSNHIKFSDSASTDTKEGNIYLLLLSDQATNTPTIDFNSRLRYVDN